MNRSMQRPLGAFAATALVVGLTLGGGAPAQAKVKGKDLPTRAQFATVAPALKAKGSDYAQYGVNKATVPKKKCGSNKLVKVKSGRVADAVNYRKGTVGSVQLAEFKTKAAAKKSMKKWKRFLTKCKTYRSDVIDATGTNKVVKIPKVGHDRVGAVQNTLVNGAPYRGFVVVVRHGKRVAVADLAQGKAVTKKKRNKYTKLVAKKMP